MQTGPINYHRIMFFLDVLSSVEEKIAYITHMRKEVLRIIECFESEKSLQLRMYASDNLHIEDNCNELKDFLQLMIKRYSTDLSDHRSPSNEELKRLVKKEILEYKKLDEALDYHLKQLLKEVEANEIKKEIPALNDEQFSSDENVLDEVEIDKKDNQVSDSPLDKYHFTSSVTSDTISDKYNASPDKSEESQTRDKKIEKKDLPKIEIDLTESQKKEKAPNKLKKISIDITKTDKDKNEDEETKNN